MITTPNPYLQFYFDFLKRNNYPGLVYLTAFESGGCTTLQYDTDDKYLMQDQELLMSLPCQNLYGQVAEQWWQLLAKRELMQPHSPVAQAGPAPSTSASIASGRRAELQPGTENALYLYLEQQLMGACPADVRRCYQLDELHRIADEFTAALNDRIQQAVVGDLAGLSRSDFGISAAQLSITMLNVWPWGQVIGKHEDYTFIDGVVVSNVQENHQRPFQFAGIWVELPDNTLLELPVQLSFTDSRQQAVATLNVAQSKQLTTQWCLEQGYKQLVLDPKFRQVVETYGVVDAAQPAKRWLSNGQLLVDLVRYHAEAHKDIAPRPVCESVNGLDWLLPEDAAIASNDQDELPF